MYLITPLYLPPSQKLQLSDLDHQGTLIFYKYFPFGNGDYYSHVQIKVRQGSKNHEIIDLKAPES